MADSRLLPALQTFPAVGTRHLPQPTISALCPSTRRFFICVASCTDRALETGSRQARCVAGQRNWPHVALSFVYLYSVMCSNWKGFARKRLWPNRAVFRHLPWREWRRYKKGNRYPARHSNPAPSQMRVKRVTTSLTRSEKFVDVCLVGTLVAQYSALAVLLTWSGIDSQQGTYCILLCFCLSVCLSLGPLASVQTDF
jgi:hypothetical protein